MQQQYADTTARPAAMLVQTPQHALTIERELPMLAGIGAFVTWCEDLLNILSGPVITAGLVIALVALLTDGDLLVKIPSMTYIWAVSMALGVDAQFVGSAAKAARAIRQRRPWAAFGYFVLCGALGYVGYIASNVFATQEAQGITMAQALQHLGMDGSMWIFQRSFLAVVLVFLSGFLRYVAPGKNVAQSTTEEKERLQAELELEPLRAQLRQQKVRDLRAAALTAVGRDSQSQQQQQSERPRIVAASSTLPPVAPPVAHTTQAYNMMHDADEYDPYGIPDESEEQDTSYSTRSLPEFREPHTSLPRTAREYSRARAGKVDDFEEMGEDDDADASYPNSRHQRKKGKTATGRMNQRQRTQKLARQAQEKQADNARDHIIEQAVALVASEISETGEDLSSYQLEDRVNEALERMGSTVRTSRKTAMKKLRIWLAEHGAKSAPVTSGDDDEDESQELRELVAQEAW